MSSWTETEVRTRLITPALTTAGWDPLAFREEYFYFSAGRIQVTGQKGRRKKPKRIDYLLEYRPDLPVAVVEAKDNNHDVGAGMQQALEYAEDLDVPSVFTSNGDNFVWHDRSGQRTPAEQEIALDEFPSPAELYVPRLSYSSAGDGNSFSAISCSAGVRWPDRSCQTKLSPLLVNTEGTSKSSAYSSACCMPAPTSWLLSFASTTATGRSGRYSRRIVRFGFLHRPF